MGIFNVTLLDQDTFAHRMGKGTVLYEGDDLEEANRVANEAGNNPSYKGRTIRFYDFHLFGGGMKDRKIAA